LNFLKFGQRKANWAGFSQFFLILLQKSNAYRGFMQVFGGQPETDESFGEDGQWFGAVYK